MYICAKNLSKIYVYIYLDEAKASGDRLEMARATFTLGRTYHQWANVESNLPKLEVNRLLGLAEQYFKQSMEITEICRRR